MSDIRNTGAWKKLTKQLKQDRTELVDQLILITDEKAADRLRGKIMQIDDIIESYPLQIAQASSDTEYDT